MSSVWQDVRYALRMMIKAPGLTAVLLVTLALGIGASTTIFSVVHSVVLKPLPYREPDRIVRVYTEFRGKMDLHKFWFSVPEVGDLMRDCRSCEYVGAWVRGTAPLAGGDRPVNIQVAYSTHTLLPLLGVRPILGRWFDASEDTPVPAQPGNLVGDPDVIVLGHDVWKRAFGGDPNIVGKQVHLDAMPVTVVGVMPAGFDFLDGEEAWVPARFDYANGRRGSHSLNVVARMKPGVSIAQLRDELDALKAGYAKGDGPMHHVISDRHPMIAMPFHEDVVGSLAKTLWLLQAAVLFVLLISVVNVANLLLARAESRTREVAVRHALGASRPRLLRQFVTESLVLGLLGGALGVLVAVWAVDGVTALIPKAAPRASEIQLDGAAVIFAVACALIAGVLFGLTPIVHARRGDVYGALKDGSPRMTGSRARLRLRRALVIAEIGLAVVLVIGCTVMVRSFVRLQHVDLGFEPGQRLTFGVTLPQKAYPSAAADAFWDRLEQRLAALPGVKRATMIDGPVPLRPLTAEDIELVGKVHAKDQAPWNVDYWQLVGPGGLETLGARLVRGRMIEASDVEGAPRVIVVNEAFVAKFYPGEDPLGQHVTTYSSGDATKDKPAEIVGIVRDLKNAGIDKPAGTEIFMPRRQYAALNDPPVAPYTQNAVVWADGDPADLIPAVHRVVAALDPSVPIYQVRTMDDLMWEAVARPRFLTFLLTSFALIALLLAAVGIYGVMAHTVAQRTHEIGLRVALGAQPAQVRTMVLRQAAMLVGAGIAAGLVATMLLQLALAGALRGLFYGATLSQPVLLVAVAIVVAATALLATWIPARRATRVQPTVALRSE